MQKQGCFLQILLPNQAQAYVLRSQWAHARIRSIDISAALSMPGVLAIYTGADMAQDNITDLPSLSIQALQNVDGSKPVNHGRPILVQDEVRYVGDCIAFVVAETLNQARDAAEKIELDIEELQSAANLSDAMADGAPQIRDDAPGNISFDWQNGNEAAVNDAFGVFGVLELIDDGDPVPHLDRARDVGRFLVVGDTCEGDFA